MTPSSCKSKGRRAAAEVKELLLEWCPDLQPDDIIVTSSGVTGEDLQLSPKAREVYPYIIEAKNVEKINIHQANEQAVSHWQKRGSKPNEFPIVCYKRNRTDLYVSIKLEHFLKLTR